MEFTTDRETMEQLIVKLRKIYKEMQKILVKEETIYGNNFLLNILEETTDIITECNSFANLIDDAKKEPECFEKDI